LVPGGGVGLRVEGERFQFDVKKVFVEDLILPKDDYWPLIISQKALNDETGEKGECILLTYCTFLTPFI